jgi:hypothetical protein
MGARMLRGFTSCSDSVLENQSRRMGGNALCFVIFFIARCFEDQEHNTLNGSGEFSDRDASVPGNDIETSGQLILESGATIEVHQGRRLILWGPQPRDVGGPRISAWPLVGTPTRTRQCKGAAPPAFASGCFTGTFIRHSPSWGSGLDLTSLALETHHTRSVIAFPQAHLDRAAIVCPNARSSPLRSLCLSRVSCACAITVAGTIKSP